MLRQKDPSDPEVHAVDPSDPGVDAAEVREVLLGTWGLLFNSSRWARDSRRDGLDPPGRPAVAWSLHRAFVREAARIASFPLTASRAIERLLDQLACERGYENAIALNETGSHDEVMLLLKDAISRCDEFMHEPGIHPEEAYEHPISLEHLYLRYRAPLLALCTHWLKDESQAEDLVQDSILKGYLSFAGQKPVWPWIVAIAKRKCMDHNRTRSSDLPLDTLDASTNGHRPDDTPFEEAVRDQERLDLDSRLAALPSRQRRALVLYAFEGWSYEEVASFEGSTVKAVRKAVSRARQSMRSLSG